MSARNHLSDRYQHILKATIQHYIATAEPVGSKTLLEEYKFTISSATIRNALGKLEKEGLLYQPHTSSGRINPTLPPDAFPPIGVIVSTSMS